MANRIFSDRKKANLSPKPINKDMAADRKGKFRVKFRMQKQQVQPLTLEFKQLRRLFSAVCRLYPCPFAKSMFKIRSWKRKGSVQGLPAREAAAAQAGFLK